MLNNFDVVVVGAGPGGGHCARLLAKQNYKVLLLERYKDFSRNSFSSAATPHETLTKFDLPETIVGSWWNKLVVVTSQKKRVWESNNIQGSVLDFTKMRQFLADEVTHHGGDIWLGCRYLNHIERENDLLITVKNNLLNQEINVTSKVLVDATGASRGVMCRRGKPKPNFLNGTGIEYLIEVSDEVYQQNADTLTFLLGNKWMPKGYSWLFPMEKNILKVGAGVIIVDKKEDQLNGKVKLLGYYVELLIKEYLKTDSYKLLDIHGETLRYTPGLQDTYTEGRIIAIGDTVSTVNWLGGEGIRHAMESAEIANQFINRFLEGKVKNFDGYQQKMHSTFLTKWNISEKLARKQYIKGNDNSLDKVFSYVDGMTLEDLVNILFYYKFEKVSKGFLPFIIRKLRQKIKTIFKLN